MLGPATHEAEHDVFTLLQIARGVRRGVQGMARAVVSGVHHYKLIGQAMLPPEAVALRSVELHMVIVRPRGDHTDSLFRNAFGPDPVAHQVIEHYHAIGTA